ncbi:unnamed protein product [Leptosia nina]|uniref:Chitin synthase export chaperone n=1 Tax=Leptosia nina TaxID=320188 RepID=A0AAV1JC77_9NEOP
MVVNTGNLINERATPTLGISHALIAPTAIMVTYIVISIFIIGSLRRQYASWFFHVYALVACCLVQILLSFTVFKELNISGIADKYPALALNGVLPMINTVLLIVDLTVITLSSRDAVSPPSSLQNSGANLEIQHSS